MRIGNFDIGTGRTFIIAEIGINHNGSMDLAFNLIDAAVEAGADAVKFQKRHPHAVIPEHLKGTLKDTPWGKIPYEEYRLKLELSLENYKAIDKYCQAKGIMWFASAWDIDSFFFLFENFDVPVYKIPSPMLTNVELLDAAHAVEKPIILSTGMSNLIEINNAVCRLELENLLIAQCTSIYPCPIEKLNLAMIAELRSYYPQCPIGYSGHEWGVNPTVWAVAMGAAFVERHITLDMNLWGADQRWSLIPAEFSLLVMKIRDFEQSRGDGIKRVYPEEEEIKRKLRI